MFIIRIFLLFFILFPSVSFAQENFRVAYYDMECLYDTIPNAEKESLGFMPSGKYHWNSYKYWSSIKRLKQVTDSLSNPFLPSMFIISGLENDAVVKDVVRKNSSFKERYNYRLTNHPFSKTQTALLYQLDQFKLLSFNSIDVDSESFTSTDYNLFYVKGKLISGDTLHIFSCRQVNDLAFLKDELQCQRCILAKVLAEKIERVYQNKEQANIILIGDFLDPPNAKTILSCLNAKEIEDVDSEIKGNKSLYSLFPSSRFTEEGTYKNGSDWYIYDQAFVSQKLLDPAHSIRLTSLKSGILFSPFLLQKDKIYGGLKPFGMYEKTYFQKGYSNHLPIYIDLVVLDE